MDAVILVLGISMGVAIVFKVVFKLLKKHLSPKLQKTQRQIEDELTEMARRALDE